MDMPMPDASVLARRDRILAQLAAVLPGDALISDPTETRAYECDALTAYRCPPLAAVLPRSTAEVSAVLRITVYVQSAPGFTQQSEVADGASEVLYRVLGRFVQGERSAILAGDPDGSELQRRLKAVRREAHHLHAFVRFQPCKAQGAPDGAGGARRCSRRPSRCRYGRNPTISAGRSGRPGCHPARSRPRRHSPG